MIEKLFYVTMAIVCVLLAGILIFGAAHLVILVLTME
jgi:cell division protein FtsL